VVVHQPHVGGELDEKLRVFFKLLKVDAECHGGSDLRICNELI
jgi:hypothetical protein